MSIPLDHLLILSFALFLIGIAGLFMRKDALTMILCVQIIFLAANIVFVGASRSFGDAIGHIVMLVISVVAVAQAIVGFSIVLYLRQSKKPLEVKKLKELRG